MWSETVHCSVMSSSLWSPGSSVHGILQARILEWVAIPFSRASSWPRDQTQVSCIAGRFFTVWATREGPHTIYTSSHIQKVYFFIFPQCPALCISNLNILILWLKINSRIWKSKLEDRHKKVRELSYNTVTFILDDHISRSLDKW